MLGKLYDTFGIDEKNDEPHYHKHIRNIAINWACQAHLEQCLNDTKTKVSAFLEGVGKISKNHEPAILCNGLRGASDADYASMMSELRKTDDPRLRELFIRSMGCIENEALISRFILEIIENVDNVSNEWQTALDAMYTNGPIGVRVALLFLRIHYGIVIQM